MKPTGIVRNVDNLGRIVLPIELRRTFNIDVKDAVEIFTDDDAIILKKYERACVFCNGSDGVCEYKGKAVCIKCLDELKSR